MRTGLEPGPRCGDLVVVDGGAVRDLGRGIGCSCEPGLLCHWTVSTTYWSFSRLMGVWRKARGTIIVRMGLSSRSECGGLVCSDLAACCLEEYHRLHAVIKRLASVPVFTYPKQ